MFYFREGFCWTNILNPNAKLLKSKLKQKTVNDVGSMSLTSIVDIVPNFYFVALLNSEFLFNYYRVYINNTVNIQINDIRQLPVIIPTKIEMEKVKVFFDKLIILKKYEYETDKKPEIEIENLESKIDEILYKSYFTI